MSGAASDPLRLLTIEEAAKVLGVDKAEVTRLVREGQLAVHRVGASAQPRIPRRAIEAWVEGLVARQSARQSRLKRSAPGSVAQRPTELGRGVA